MKLKPALEAFYMTVTKYGKITLVKKRLIHFILTFHGDLRTTATSSNTMLL